MSPRVPSSLEIWFHLGRQELRGHVVNINLSGFFAATRVELPVGQLIQMRLAIPDQAAPLQCFGWVRNCDPGRGAGVQFFAMTKEALDRWAAYYHACRRGLAGAAPPPAARAEPAA